MSDLDNFYTSLTPIVELKDFHPLIRIWMKRDELTHPILSGNKWRKLKYNLIEAKKNNIKTLVTKGGYYSNHLAAVSEAGKLFNFKTIGIIRGEEPKEYGHTLKLLIQNRMNLIFVSRSEYNQINETNYLSLLSSKENTDFIPEGGTNQLALKGCREIIPEVLNQLDFEPTHWCVSIGTGGTIAGMLQSLPDNSTLLGFSALKGDFHYGVIENLTGIHNLKNLTITDRFSGKGYAKIDDELMEFINSFYDKYEIQLEPVYTGKMMMGIYQLAEEGYFPFGSRIVCLHTGGLQGWGGFSNFG